MDPSEIAFSDNDRVNPTRRRSNVHEVHYPILERKMLKIEPIRSHSPHNSQPQPACQTNCPEMTQVNPERRQREGASQHRRDAKIVSAPYKK